MTPVADETRARLLAAAGPLFAEHGYRQAGVKDICDAAACNVAAISYHFGSKQDFYAAVLEHAHRSAFAGSPMPVAVAGTAPAVAFAEWLRWWMGSMLHPDRPVWLQTLMAREMVDPTPALDAMVERSIRPMYARLSALVRALLPRGVAAAVARNCTNSVLGQVLVHKHAAPVLHRLGALPGTDAADLRHLIDHVIAFSLAGIAAAASAPTASRRRSTTKGRAR